MASSASSQRKRVVLLGATGWATKDRWWPEVRRRLPIEVPARPPEASRVTVEAT